MSKKYQKELQLTYSNKANEIIKTLPDFCNKYFDNMRNKNMSEKSIIQYAYDIKKFTDWLSSSAGFKNKNIKTLTAHEVLDKLTIEDYNEYLKSINFVNKDNNTSITSPAFKARRISSLRSFLKYYFKIGDTEKCMADLLDIPKQHKKIIVVLDQKDVSRLLNTIKEPVSHKKQHNLGVLRDTAIITLFLGTGIRVSELVGIDIKDLDFYNASLIVVRKGGDEDEVYFNEDVQSALEKYINEERNLYIKNRNEPALFVSNRGNRITIRQVERIVKKYSAIAGINNDISCHSLRKTFGTHLYEETGDIYLVADALHHSSVETTKKHYAKMEKDHKRIAAEKSSSLFKN